jgi:hypothetical protein
LFIFVEGFFLLCAKMSFSKSLRVVGQSLQVAKVFVFDLQSDGRNYLVQSDSMSRTAEWILRYGINESDFSTLACHPSAAGNPVEFKPVQFSDADIARLNAREAKRRRELSSSRARSSTKLSQLLRTLGDYLDRNSARTFRIFWKPDSVVVDYTSVDGLPGRRRFTREKLLQLDNSGLCRSGTDH